MRVSMARHRRAGIGMHAYLCIYTYIYKYIYIPMMHLVCTDMHASCMDPLCTQVSMSVCTQTDRYRWGARVSLAIRSAEYIMCTDIRLYLDTCTSERRRGAGGRAVVAGARAGAPAWVASASGYNHRAVCTGVSITRMWVCVRAMCGDFLWLRPVRPHGRPWSRGGRGRTRARCAAGPSTPRR